jgi:hypothetical protein
MNVTISLTPDTVKIGTPVLITYSAEDCADVTLTIDNYPNPIDVGGGDYIDGTMQFLPLTDGVVNVTITGTGRNSVPSDYMPEVTKSASVNVN